MSERHFGPGRSVEQIQADIQANGPIPDSQGDAVRAEIKEASIPDDGPRPGVIVVEVEDATCLPDITSVMSQALVAYIEENNRKSPCRMQIHLAILDTAEAILNRIKLDR